MIQTKTLGNGVRIVMEEMPQVESLAIGIWVRTGAIDETEANAGASHFVEHMMFKGTEKRNAREIAASIDRIGGQMNAFTGKEATCYYVKCVYSNFRKAAEVLCDMVENSLFETKELDRERQVVCEEIKMSQDTPDDVCQETFTEGIFAGSGLGNSILGTPESLERIDHDVIMAYKNAQYTRDSIVVSVAGKFDQDEVCDYFSQHFLNLGESKPANVIVPDSYKPFRKVVTKDIQQSHLILGTKAIQRTDERFYSLNILNNLLGGSMSSRLFQNIREEKGLAYTVMSMMGLYSGDGFFEIYAGVGHDKVEATIQAIKEELDLLAASSVLQEELDSSREQIKSAYVFSQESSTARMQFNGKSYLLEGTIRLPEEILKAYDAVSLASIDAVKTLLCDFDRYSAVAVSGSDFDLTEMMARVSSGKAAQA